MLIPCRLGGGGIRRQNRDRTRSFRYNPSQRDANLFNEGEFPHGAFEALGSPISLNLIPFMRASRQRFSCFQNVRASQPKSGKGRAVSANITKTRNS